MNMPKKPLLSIAIPTYNRAGFLKNLLRQVVPQAKALGGLVEICISNNASSDTTREIIMSFKDAYPDLITYHENEKNLGYDRNILKAIELAVGEFIWTFGDDDLVKYGGLDEIIKLIKKSSIEKTGLIFVRREEYFIDKKNGEKIICCNTVDKLKPEIFMIDKKDVMGMYTADPGFMSVLIFNGRILKNIIKEDRLIVEKGMGIGYMHVLLQSLIFLKYPYLDAVSLNRLIILQELPMYKFFIEDTFRLNYKEQKRLNNLLLSSNYMNDNYAPLFIKNNKKLWRKFVVGMVKLRAFKSFNYLSYTGCLKLFFQYAAVLDALFFSFIFSLLILFPAILFELAYKTFLMVKHGRGWRAKWIFAYMPTQGSRRLNTL